MPALSESAGSRDTYYYVATITMAAHRTGFFQNNISYSIHDPRAERCSRTLSRPAGGHLCVSESQQSHSPQHGVAENIHTFKEKEGMSSGHRRDSIPHTARFTGC